MLIVALFARTWCDVWTRRLANFGRRGRCDGVGEAQYLYVSGDSIVGEGNGRRLAKIACWSRAYRLISVPTVDGVIVGSASCVGATGTTNVAEQGRYRAFSGI